MTLKGQFSVSNVPGNQPIFSTHLWEGKGDVKREPKVQGRRDCAPRDPTPAAAAQRLPRSSASSAQRTHPSSSLIMNPGPTTVSGFSLSEVPGGIISLFCCCWFLCHVVNSMREKAVFLLLCVSLAPSTGSELRKKLLNEQDTVDKSVLSPEVLEFCEIKNGCGQDC